MCAASQVRLAVGAEAGAVHRLLLSVRQEIGLTYLFEQSRYQDWVQGNCEKRLIWVVVRGSDIIGTMMLERNKISYLAVRSDWQGQGIGRQFMQKAKSKYKRLRVEVKPQNSKMIAFLKREGFEKYHPPKCSMGYDAYRWLRSDEIG